MPANTSYLSTSLLLPGVDDLADKSPLAVTPTVNGAAALSATQSKFYGHSISFPSDGSNIVIPYNASTQNLGDINGVGVGTFDAWIYPTSVSTRACILNRWTASTGWTVDIDGSGNIFITVGGSGNSFAAGITLNVWQHLRIIFDYNVLYMYVNGIYKGFTTIGGGQGTQNFYIGQRSDAALQFYGYMNDVCFTPGVIKNNLLGNFTPPGALKPRVITGNITESLAITNWRVVAVDAASGDLAGTALSGEGGSTYSLVCADSDPVILTVLPKIDYSWSKTRVVAADDYCVPVNPDTTPKLYKATSIGSSPHNTGSSEPTWPSSGTVSDGDITWTFIAALVDPVSIGPKVPA
jgi:hypothetical protein